MKKQRPLAPRWLRSIVAPGKVDDVQHWQAGGPPS
jgi:hypothetical protein